MARKKAVKKYTLAEFKAWLEGIEEIQPTTWHPDLDQWRMIREKIGAIVEPPPPKPVVVQQGGAATNGGPTIRRQPQVPVAQQPVGGSVLDEVASTPGQLNPVVPAGDLTPAAKAALAGKLPKEIAIGAEASKTPNIDTMDGNYESNFG